MKIFEFYFCSWLFLFLGEGIGLLNKNIFFMTKNSFQNLKIFKLIFFIFNLLMVIYSKNDIKVMYYVSSNFGDNLNYILLRKMIRRPTSFSSIISKKDIKNDKYVSLLNEIAKSDFFFIGSILEVLCNWYNEKDKYKSIISKWYFKIYNYFHPLIIFGTGFISNNSRSESYVRNIKIIAVRGNLTLQRLKKNGISVSDSVILADPAILSPLILTENDKTLKKIYKLCIIPHSVDKNNQLIIDNIHINKSLILNIDGDPFIFIDNLTKCERVLSSSLHGLIISDSFGIPNMRIVLSDSVIGGDYKFSDYYSSYGLELPLKIDLRQKTFNESQLNLIDSNYKIPIDMIKKKQCQLLINFPFLLNKNYTFHKKICTKSFF